MNEGRYSPVFSQALRFVFFTVDNPFKEPSERKPRQETSVMKIAVLSSRGLPLPGEYPSGHHPIPTLFYIPDGGYRSTQHASVSRSCCNARPGVLHHLTRSTFSVYQAGVGAGSPGRTSRSVSDRMPSWQPPGRRSTRPSRSGSSFQPVQIMS